MDDLGFDTRLKPRRSFSTLSDTTVNSSVVNRMIVENSTTNNNHFAIENFVRDSNANPQRFNFEGSSDIRVGDAIYHIYYPPPNADRDESRTQRKASSVKSSEQEVFKTPRESMLNKLKKFKLHIIIITLVVILISIATPLGIFLIPKNDPQEVTTIDPTESTTIDPTTTFTISTTIKPTLDLIVPRSEWTSDPINPSVPLLSNFFFPIRRIIVGQTDDTETCMNRTECISKVQAIKNRHPTLLDIPWNFLIGGDGHVYEGRGYRFEGQHTMNVDASDYNDIGIGIGFIGNFSTQAPSSMMTNALRSFIEEAVDNGSMFLDHKIFFQDHLKYKTVEASKLRDALKEMDEFYELQRIVKREEWGAERPGPGMESLKNPLDRVIIHHTATDWPCYNYQNCTAWLRVLQKNAKRLFDLLDINYNFIIGGAGDYAVVMEGRGFNNKGAHTLCCNSVSDGIGLIGNFNNFEPGPALMSALRTLIDDSAALGKLKPNFPVHLKQDIDGATSPGVHVVNIIKTWPDYVKYVKP